MRGDVSSVHTLWCHILIYATTDVKGARYANFFYLYLDLYLLLI